jgi:hypothetical protein
MKTIRAKTCQVEGCAEKHYGHGLCKAHWTRFRNYGRFSLIRALNGQGTLTRNGYVLISVSGKRKYERIYLAEKALGRSLPKGAHVHHVNGNKSDNSPGNLVVCHNALYHALIARRGKEWDASHQNT